MTHALHIRTLGLGLIVSTTMHAQAPPNPSAATFEKSCYGCHSIGGGDKQGPDLKGVGTRRTRAWLATFVASPSTMNAAGDPIATDLFRRFSSQVMPDQALSSEQIESMIDFIDGVSASGQQFVPAGAKLARPVRLGDAALGLRLFTGQNALTNGGPACISCHSIAAIGSLGGGTLGPDLTTLNLRFPDPAVISMLQNPNFPTMNPVFGTRKLTPEEIVQLFALFQSEAARESHTPVMSSVGVLGGQSRFIIAGGIGMLIGLGTINLLWRRRFTGVRDQLVRSMKS